MRITSLSENTAQRADVQTEHGLSLYIEAGSHRILFDMGQSELFLQNADTLDIDLSRVDVAVLSHGHYDHGGGLAAFLKINAHAPVFLHRNAFLPYYNGTEKYIGLDPALSAHPRLHFTQGCHAIAPGLTLYDCNDKKRPHSFGSAGLCKRVGEELLPDDFLHEQYLLITEGERRVLISGCSHKGILDIAAWFLPDVLVGGFHFSKLPLDGTLTAAAQALNAHPTTYYTCHCTGRAQYEFMKQEMPRLHYLACGESIEI